MSSDESKWPWAVACLLGLLWGGASLLFVWSWELSGLSRLLANPPVSFDSTGHSAVQQISLDPTLRHAAKLTSFWCVAAVVFAVVVYFLVARRLGPALLAMIGGSLAAFIFNAGGALIGSFYDPPVAHVGDILGMKPVSWAGDAMLLFVPALVGAVVLLALSRWSGPGAGPDDDAPQTSA